MNISSHYNLGSQQPNLNFVDIQLTTDNRFFVDPRLIECLDSSLGLQMHKCIEVFWSELIKKIRKKDVKATWKILAGLSEPKETRLGYAQRRFGNSIAKELKQKLVDAIIANKAVQSGVLSHFSDVELFIKDVSSDRISDITTKIIKSVLIQFTQEECRKHNIPMVKVMQDDIFDPYSVTWMRKEVLLPIFMGQPIIFVPKNIIRKENVADKNVACFYRFAVRNFILHDKQMLKDVSPTGKEGKILIRDVQSKYPLSKESLTNWVVQYGKLLVDYKTDHLKGRLAVLQDWEIMEIVYQDGNRNAG